jgi:hypothetical protein
VLEYPQSDRRPAVRRPFPVLRGMGRTAKSGPAGKVVEGSSAGLGPDPEAPPLSSINPWKRRHRQARGCLHCGGQRFESPQLHQVVRANRRHFLRHRIARHFRSLPRQGSVSVGGPAILRGNSRRVLPKVSGRKFPFPRLLFAACPARPTSNGNSGLEPRHLTRFGMDGSAPRGKTNEQARIVPYAWRLEPERPPLVRLERTMCRDRQPASPATAVLHGNCRSSDSRGGVWHRMAVNLSSRPAS